MSWAPNDLVSDVDVAAYESTFLGQFGVTEWTEKRARALEDWLWPILRGRGFDPERFRTRFAPTQVWGYTGSAYTDYTSAASDQTADDVPLAAIFATPASDALYIGSLQPFRGLSVRMLDDVSATTSAASVSLWCDTWRGSAISDATQITSGKSFSGGGAITWTVPEAMVTREIYSVRGYWARVMVSAALTAGTAATQIGVIRRSVLCAPATFRTLALICREAPAAQDGPWLDKAVWYEQQAADALERAIAILGGEFDTVTEDDIVDSDEAAQTSAEVSGVSGFTLERG